jgi:hypothetical protein
MNTVCYKSISFLAVCIGLATAGCERKDEQSNSSNSEKVPGMSNHDYLACDGGPHLVLPRELGKQWKGAGSLAAVLSPKSDYGRACAATTNKLMALIAVGSGNAIVLANPPMSAWGHSPESWIDIYYLNAWSDTNLDALIQQAVAAVPTTSMTNSGNTITLSQPGMVLMYSGEPLGSTAYGQYSIPINPGAYNILAGTYNPNATNEVHIYRFQPKTN